MNKMIMNRLTMLAVTLMASMACFAQGKFDKGMVTSIPGNVPVGETFDYKELKYLVNSSKSGYLTTVVGFSDGVKNNPDYMDTGGPTGKEFDPNTVHIVHYVPADGDAPRMSVQDVATDAFKTVDSELASKVDTLIIDYDDSQESLDKSEYVILPTTGSTFAGLTALEDVKVLTPSDKVKEIPESTFAADIYDNAYLDMPSGAVKKYNTTAAWSNFFYKKLNGALLGDYDGDGKLTVTDIENMLYASFDQSDYDELYDYDGDGKITVTDLENFLYMSF